MVQAVDLAKQEEERSQYHRASLQLKRKTSICNLSKGWECTRQVDL